MLIENPEMLKVWLAANLEPLCDADPAALAKYVFALVKKDKSEDELRDVCLDQLDVFLQKETKNFVTTLFDVLKNKTYIKSSNGSSAKSSVKNVKVSAIQSVDPVSSNNKDPNSVSTSQKKVLKEDSKSTENISPVDKDKIIKSRRSRSSSPHTKSRSRSRSPHSHRTRSKDDRRQRNRYEEDSRKRNKLRRGNGRVPNESHRERDKDLRNHDKNSSQAKSRSRSRSKSSSPKPKDKRSDSENSHRDVDYRVPAFNKRSESQPQNSSTNNKTPMNKRCQDYDEKGFCMRGDLCPYDHGTDPVVVEDVNLPNVLGFHPSGANSNAPITSRSSNSTRRRPPLLATMPNASFPNRPVASSAHPPLLGNFPEGYNPEAPGIEGSGRMSNPFWYQTQPPPNFGPRAATPFTNAGQQPRTLIGVPVVKYVSKDDEPASKKEIENTQSTTPSEVKVDSDAPVNNVIDMPENDRNFKRLGKRKMNKIIKPPFRPGKHKFSKYGENCILELRKIPPELNTITELNNHFGKFGNIVNLQICYEGDPEAALITFSTNTEANTAYRSTEPILNNRFIKVFWHNKENSLKPDENKGIPQKVSIKDRLGSMKIAPVSSSNTNTTASDKSSSVHGSGSLSRTVYNTAALKKSNVSNQLSSATAQLNRMKVEEQRKETLKKNVDLQKRKQELLEKQIQQQKLLIEKIEKNKSMPAEDKEAVMKTIMQLSESIEATKKQISDSNLQSSVINNNTKSKLDTQKEILDAELELYNKQHAGIDTSDLKKKVDELKNDATARGLIIRSSLPFGGARGGRKFRGGKQWHYSVNNLDSRPKKIKVHCLDGSNLDKTEIVDHFNKTAEVENCVESDKCLIVSFKTRKDAENAAKFSAKFKDKMLVLNWYNDLTSKSNNKGSDGQLLNNNVIGENNEDISEDREDSLIGDDEEEEEDSEARSWRR